MSKQALLEHEMGPEISGFVVFKEMRDNQQFNIEEAISIAHGYFKKHSPESVFKMIAKDN